MTPDAFLDDWYGYATNQSGHFVIGLVCVFFCYLFLKSSTRSLALVAFVYLAWEVSQLFQGGTVLDGLEDMLFVLMGGVFSVGAIVVKREYILLSLIITVVAMVNGVMRRKK